jgi:hypothetical protein
MAVAEELQLHTTVQQDWQQRDLLAEYTAQYVGAIHTDIQVHYSMGIVCLSVYIK